MDNEVEVLPDVVVVLQVVLEAFFGVSIEYLSVEIANEAEVLDILICLRFKVTKLSEGVDNNTKDDVEQDCDQDQEETQIVASSEIESLLVLTDRRLGWKEVSNTTTTSQSVVDSRHEAVEHGLAD